MKKINILYWALLITGVVTTSCSNEDLKGTPSWAWEDPIEPESEPIELNPEIVELGWTNVKDTYGTLPTYLNVYKSPGTLSDKKAIAYIAVADMNEAKFNVWGNVKWSDTAKGYGSETVKTPSKIYEERNVPVIINGGLFFWDNSNLASGFYYSQSLMIRDGALLAPNQNYYSEDWVTVWYPTIGAFCQMKDGSFKATWTYIDNNGTNYYYPAPAENSINQDPLEIPSATFPEGAQVLEAKTAIGGVGVLVHEGAIKNTYVQEMLDVSSDSDQPRSAIGITESKKIIIFVCEGRGVTEGAAGLTTGNVAEVMKALGCVEALNLDGGGSSCMLINGHETIKPCNNDNEQRAVLSAVTLE